MQQRKKGVSLQTTATAALFHDKYEIVQIKKYEIEQLLV